MNQAFLEATRERSEALLNNHIERRRDWSLDMIREKHNYPYLLHAVSERVKSEEPFPFPDEITGALFLTLITENGIIYYPRDVGQIFNPFGKKPDDNDPHEHFTRIWPKEEFPHGEGLRDALYLTGYDMKLLEQARGAFQLSGNVPRPEDTACGVAYTGTQELSTNKPYRNIRKMLRHTIKTTDDELVRSVCEFIDEVVGHIAKDESLHAAFINGTADAAFETRDPELTSFMLHGYASTLIDFFMPGRKGIPNFRKLQLEAARSGMFTPEDLAKIKHHQYKKVIRYSGGLALTQQGETSLAIIETDFKKIEAKYPDLVIRS